MRVGIAVGGIKELAEAHGAYVRRIGDMRVGAHGQPDHRDEIFRREPGLRFGFGGFRLDGDSLGFGFLRDGFDLGLGRLFRGLGNFGAGIARIGSPAGRGEQHQAETEEDGRDGMPPQTCLTIRNGHEVPLAAQIDSALIIPLCPVAVKRFRASH